MKVHITRWNLWDQPGPPMILHETWRRWGFKMYMQVLSKMKIGIWNQRDIAQMLVMVLCQLCLQEDWRLSVQCAEQWPRKGQLSSQENSLSRWRSRTLLACLCIYHSNNLPPCQPSLTSLPLPWLERTGGGWINWEMRSGTGFSPCIIWVLQRESCEITCLDMTPGKEMTKVQIGEHPMHFQGIEDTTLFRERWDFMPDTCWQWVLNW